LCLSLNVVAVILESDRSFSGPYQGYFHAFEWFSVAVFTAEYVLRLWSCTADGKFRRPVAGRLRFAATPMALVDLLAILPFYLHLVALGFFDLRFLRAVRLFRLFRLLKLARYSRSLGVLRSVLEERKEALLIAGFLVAMLFVLGGTFLFFLEGGGEPGGFRSIPHAIWWAVARIASVETRGVSPVTPPGQLLGALIVILGRIGIFALPAAILASGFISEFQRRKGD